VEPKMVDKPAFTVVGMKIRTRNEHGEVPRLWYEFVPRFAEVKGVTNRNEAYGVLDNFDPETRELDYLAGLEVGSAGEIPEGMTSLKIPAQTYAVFTTTLPDLMDTLRKIHREWLPKSGFEHTEGPDLEVYGREFDPQDETSKIYIYIPVASPQTPGP
jgi:AraC family transcriptional regulator